MSSQPVIFGMSALQFWWEVNMMMHTWNVFNKGGMRLCSVQAPNAHDALLYASQLGFTGATAVSMEDWLQ